MQKKHLAHRARQLRSWMLFTLVIVLGSCSAVQRAADQRALWNQPFEPFRIVGNIYFVGAADLSSFLIVSPGGAFLLDGGLRETAPLIERSIRKLGFRIEDVKYLLNSHAHYDHAGGLAELREKSRATMIASAADAAGLRIGSPDVTPVIVDRTIGDGDSLHLGDVTMTAHITPGHTPGCTTWTTTATEDNRNYRVVFHCGTRVVTKLIGNELYPETASDYRRTFERMRELSADVFLAEHPRFFGMAAKIKRKRSGEVNPFIDSTELGRYVNRSEQEFRAALTAEQIAEGHQDY